VGLSGDAHLPAWGVNRHKRGGGEGGGVKISGESGAGKIWLRCCFVQGRTDWRWGGMAWPPNVAWGRGLEGQGRSSNDKGGTKKKNTPGGAFSLNVLDSLKRLWGRVSNCIFNWEEENKALQLVFHSKSGNWKKRGGLKVGVTQRGVHVKEGSTIRSFELHTVEGKRHHDHKKNKTAGRIFPTNKVRGGGAFAGVR